VSKTTLSVLILSFVVFGESAATAQQANTFEQLQVLVEPGDTVSVLDFSGKTSKGTIAKLSRDSLRLVVDGVARDLPQWTVLEIKQRRSDSLANGAIIGAIPGAAWGMWVALFSDCHGNCAANQAAAIGFSAALGAGIGLGIDALIIRTHTIYRGSGRASSSHFNIAPVLHGGNRGIAMSLSF